MPPPEPAVLLLSTWLLAIVRHKALTVFRYRSADPLDEEGVACVADSADTPEMATQKAQGRSIIRNCLTQLSPAHREIIDLVYYHGKSIEEVAKIVGIGVNTVKTRMFYARQHLAKRRYVCAKTRRAARQKGYHAATA